MSGRPVRIAGLAVFGLMAGQQMLNPVLPPLTRELGFSELALGVVWAVSGAGVVVTSSFWGRRAATWGHRRVLLTSLVGAAAGLLAFAVVAAVGISGALAVPLLFALVLLTRGIAFGLSWAATPVTAQSYVAAVTTGPAERVRGMAVIGAAQGLALAVGPAVGGVLSLGGLLVPVFAAPVVLVAIAVLVRIGLPAPPTRHTPGPAVRVSALDRRFRPFLAIGFGLYLALAVVLMIVGFVVQDRLHVGVHETGAVTSLMLLAAAGMLVVVQAAVVPRLGWTSSRLMLVGTTLMIVGMVAVGLAPTLLLMSVGTAVLGTGMGFATPGVMAAPTLLATPEEQGAVAGLASASSALAFVLGPLVGTGLYGIAPLAPFVLGTGVLVAASAIAAVSRLPAAPEPVAAGCDDHAHGTAHP
ncbi:MFS transporter [Pseudonocardia sp. CA-107938]|uniref:MFS transporter n=1 Tax=Pseudonocardia sp. CA-107938 TaxID=3240021 RepID=UPI003D9260F2